MKLSVLLLLFVTLVWGTTFPIIRAASAHLSGVEITALRFLVAGLCMLPFAFKASRAAWRDGLLLGTVALVSYVAQAVGLEYISSNRSAFITSLNVLMVPFLGLLLGRPLSLQIVSAAVLACAGIGLMSWESGGNLMGDGATLACALAYAIYVILLSRRIHAHESRTLAATQIVAMAAISFVWLLVTHFNGHALTNLAAHAEPVWSSLLYLGVVASAGMLFLQAMLIETLGVRGFADGALVVAAVILGEWRFKSRPVPGQ